jgi:hypothetical protein
MNYQKESKNCENYGEKQDGEYLCRNPYFLCRSQIGDAKPLCEIWGLLVLTFTYDRKWVSTDGIQKSELAPDRRAAIPEAGEGFDGGTEKESLETMKMYDSCGFNEDQEKEI